ncbi:MAG: sn-glycerol-3-phosphate ABC transporter ATP-binding protein UgpC, partial [Clostridia bacterium]|nr:sn-glycerol-3-phosphate ABC transporter ATP-binding protein UgpC [Clostridia bacterium]
MSNLSLRHIYKVYPNGVKAVNDFNMEIEDKEFIVFVGPSGCGKSTTLRMIAGLEDITAGELYIGDSFVNRVEPKDRDIAMVFQNYALYPHMTVYENLAFGLKLRHVPHAEIHKRVLWAAKILKLEEYLERKPKALSGGQRQRVSLGRAILRTPKVFLLDEPLSNLDAKLRTEMRAEIAKLHNEIQTTFIYVTHDQVEAMTMGTRIVVMSMGYVQQIDTPQNLYNYPENKFVAGFIGTPQMNFFLATLKREGARVTIKFEGVDGALDIPFQSLLKVRPEYLNGDKKVIVGLRCEHMSVDPDVVKASKNILKVKISHFEELGNETLIYGDLDMNGDGLSDSNTRVIVKQYGGEHANKIGDIIDVAFDMEKAHFFDSVTEKTIA